MQPVLALTPIILTLVFILALKRSALVSCLGGIIAALILAKLPVGFQLTGGGLLLALESSAYLALSVALVVLPGLFLTDVLKGQGIIDGIASGISAIPLDPAAKMLILLLGVMPAVESLTGFGVSLFLSVPVLLRLFEPTLARRLALLGMNIMPWGTLALATIVGASLVNERVADLGMVSALTSAPVFPLVGLVALYTLGGWPTVRRWGLLAVLLGLGLPVLLYLSARHASVETAGVFAGLGMATLGMVGLRLSGLASAPEKTGPGLVRLFVPYLLVFALILVTRLVPPLWNWLKSAGVLHNVRVTFAPLASPGVCLLTVALLLHARRPVKLNGRSLLQRASKPILATSAFLVLAQVMREAGMIESLATSMAHLDGALLWGLVSAVGMTSGFATASNVGGNVLLISLQHAVGANHGEALLYAAAHNSSAGHAVFASLPIIMLVIAISGEVKGDTTAAVRDMLRFALGVAVILLVGLVMSFALLDSFHLVPEVLPKAL